MKKTLLLIGILLLTMFLLLGCSPAAEESTPKITLAETPAENQDDPVEEDIDTTFRMPGTGETELVLDAPPENIVSLSYGTALLMDMLDIELVGLVETKRPLPENLKALPVVGSSAKSPNMEKIIALNTDLVIMSSMFKGSAKPLFEQNNITALFLDNLKYSDNLRLLEEFGQAFNKEEKAAEVIEGMKARENKVLDRIQDKEPPTVMIIFGTAEAFMLATEKSFPGELLEILKGINVAKDLPLGGARGGFIPFSTEKVIDLNPQVILRMAHGDAEQTKRIFDEEFTRNPVWQATSAVQNNRVYDLDNQLFFANPGPKAIDALEKLADILYP